jgi:hypothetical protein
MLSVFNFHVALQQCGYKKHRNGGWSNGRNHVYASISGHFVESLNIWLREGGNDIMVFCSHDHHLLYISRPRNGSVVRSTKLLVVLESMLDQELYNV